MRVVISNGLRVLNALEPLTIKPMGSGVRMRVHVKHQWPERIKAVLKRLPGVEQLSDFHTSIRSEPLKLQADAKI
jgi:hypothetical protein